MAAAQQTQLEVLAPAGNWQSLKAAVASGADAVYLGLGSFNARQRATNFSLDELDEVVEYLHARNVLAYIAFNTLIYSDELAAAQDHAAAIAASGADAVIVQDLGLARLIHEMCPSLALHASTQMSLTEDRGIALAMGLGLTRVILARELSVEQIGRVAQACQIEIEVFVHGALCVSFSGQCLASQFLWGRSGNRGLCGQACRLPYDLLVDGQPQGGDKKYVLSPRDLAGFDHVAALHRAGVVGLKIEGRLKSEHYVAAAVRAYRLAADAAMAGSEFALPPQQQRELAQNFSRGFGSGFLAGGDHRVLVDGTSPKSRGIRIGKVVARTQRGIIAQLDGADSSPVVGIIKPGDGVAFEAVGVADLPGGSVYTVHSNVRADAGTKCVELSFANHVDLSAVPVGATIWKTLDPQLKAELGRLSVQDDGAVRPAPLRAILRGAVGEPLSLSLIGRSGLRADVASSQPMAAAQKHPLDVELARQQIGRLGGTPFCLEAVELHSPAGPAEELPILAPKSVLNDLRRRAVEQLLTLRRERSRHRVSCPDALADIRRQIQSAVTGSAPADNVPAVASLHVLVRTMEQLQALAEKSSNKSDCLRSLLGDTAVPLSMGIVYCDFAQIEQYRQAADICARSGMAFGLASPRIIMPGDESLLEQLSQLPAAAVLVRNLGSLAVFREAPSKPLLVGDCYLNAANEISAAVLAQWGLSRITPAFDLDDHQLDAMLLASAAAHTFEIPLYRHVAMFHTAHCLFAANLGGGANCRACAHPCRKHTLALRDRNNAIHPVRCDLAGRNTVFAQAVQSSLQRAGATFDRGVRHFRVELLDEMLS